VIARLFLEPMGLAGDTALDITILPALEMLRLAEGTGDGDFQAAALRWMLDHTDGAWQPHNLPNTYESYPRGDFDDCFADTHNSVTGHYGGMAILPDVIALNLMAVLAYREETA
jgi:hypothetical protein